MARANLSAFLRRFLRGAAAHTLADQSDGRLVERLRAGGDEAAFAAVLARHGPMVYRVCWRVLQQEQDAEDAFQAAFLLLAQRPSAVHQPSALASWLHGVALRMALRAKTQAAARRRHEQRASLSPAASPDEVSWGEVRQTLDAELARLPEKWKQPLLLCYLQGRTQDEAAAQLGWGKSTLRRRLDEARQALGRRLRQRGVVGSAALAAVLLTDCVASAGPPPGLVAATAAAAARVASGQAAAAVVPAPVAALLKGGYPAVGLTKLKLAVLVCLLAAGGAGAGVLYYRSAAAPPAPPKVRVAAPLGPPKVQEPPAEVIAAWEKAGGRYGGMTTKVNRVWFTPREHPAADELPAFHFVTDPRQRLADLPEITAPFGLEIVGEDWVTDAGLKQLAGLKALQTLSLHNTWVTSAGLKELAGLESLQSLDLSRAKVADAGLKELVGKDLRTLDPRTLLLPVVGLKDLAALKSLRTLQLGGTLVTDAGLKELAALQTLQTLDLSATYVTDAGLKELAPLKSLQSLDLAGAKVTDAGMKELANLKALQKLELDGTAVTDAGLKELAGLKGLQTLDLSGTKVTDAGLKELALLKSLQTLHLARTLVTDAGLKELALLKELKELHLHGTKVTDAGLKELARLKSLQTLDLGLGGTREAAAKVTDAGVEQLQKALPGCRIYH